MMSGIKMFSKDLDRLHRERDSFQQHARLLAEEARLELEKHENDACEECTRRMESGI